jgi:hypothetical protein
MDEYPEDGEEEERVECPTCGRRFKEQALPKHAKVCKKVFVNKRKAFDTKQQRILDSDHASLLKQKEIEEKKKKKAGSDNNLAAKKAKWKKQSEEFRSILRQANADEAADNFVVTKGNGKDGKNITTVKGNAIVSTPSVLTEDYKLCSMCNRKYNESAYSKHLPTCEKRTKEANIKSKGKSPSVSNNTIQQPTNHLSSKGNLNMNANMKYNQKK